MKADRISNARILLTTEKDQKDERSRRNQDFDGDGVQLLKFCPMRGS
jgi:hypothetical protein